VRELLTDLLDILGLLLLAGGATAAAYRWVGWTGLAAGGAVVLAGSSFAHWQARPVRGPKGPPG
jgi:hypothetical protein